MTGSAAKPMHPAAEDLPVAETDRGQQAFALASVSGVPTTASTPLFKKVLIANRGEIALRVICACKDLGIRTVAVYSEADRNSLHVSFADEAICIGPARSSQSYLDFPRVISAAEIANADAIHPGYGFLSENADFAEVCEISGLRFIGPSPEVIRLMGNKDRARATMKAAGVPVLPGSDGVLNTVEEALEVAEQIGYPVIVKASAGGGGRGMRIARSAAELPVLFGQARHEADQAFACPDVYIEKFIENPRHIEFQVMCDAHGNARVLGERECSIQRRHQKLVEEAPSPAVSPELRRDISARLEKALRDVGYVNAGTVEFLMDETGSLYFIEVNARIQVEHPVTEMVTGLDLVKTQILVACGANLKDILPETVEIRGHAIECRINAEDPVSFKPSPGRITAFHPAGGIGVRVDSHIYVEGVIPPYYDSLVAKLIVHGVTRDEAIARARRALDMFIIEGIQTSIPLHKKILSHPDFASAKLDTGFLERTGVLTS
ncbi:MAG: acetyl-CoA carboxylase biotin carboxylase subunit [Bryobacterales bacterium]|nr:acetyl-CoA carboxylase biotin carboxylase subunit [Bryobacterales bacterium]